MNCTQPSRAACQLRRSLRIFSLVAITAFAATALATTAQAQETGVVTGHVYNQATNEYLAGAQITVVGTNITALTGPGGSFDIPRIPVGPATLEVSYALLDTQQVTVNVVDGKPVTAEVALTSKKMYGDVTRLAEYVVPGELEGQAKAITKQKNAPNMVDVVDADQFPNITGGSIGNFLMNLPGISIGLSVADPRTISVRGMDPSLNSVTVNGMRAASAASGNANRQFEIDQISMQDIAQVVVTKTARADQDADSGGGTIDLVSRHAFDQKGLHISYGFNMSFNNVYADSLKGGVTNDGPDTASQVRPGANLSFSDTFFNDKLGVVFTANDYEFFTLSPATNMNVTNVSTLFGIDPSAPTGVYTSQFQYANGASFTRRHGVSLNLEYRVSDNTVIFANNQVNTSYIRSAGRGISFTATAPTTNTATTTNSVAPGYSDTYEVSRGDATSNATTAATSTSASLVTLFSGDLLNKTGAGSTFSAGSKSHFDTNAGPWEVDFTASSALATNQYDLGDQNPVGGATFFLRGLTYALSSPPSSHYPVVTQLAGPDYNQLSNYVSRVQTTSTSSQDGLTFANPLYGPMAINNVRESHATDRLDEVRLDVRHDFPWKIPFYIQAGGEVRHEYRDIDNNGREEYVYSGPAGLNFGQFVETTFQKNQVLAYPSPQFPSLTAIQNYFLANPGNFTKSPEYEIQARDTGLRHNFEAVNAGYVETNVDVTKQVSFLAGIRFEQTIEKAAGDIVNLDNGLINPATGKAYTDPVAQTAAIYGNPISVRHPYQNWFPNLQATYKITPDLLLRLAYNQQFARQQMGNIIPGASVSTSTPAVVTVNNPNLAPILFEDYDASLEYYINNAAGVGKLSVNGYYKKIRNYTGSTAQTIVAGQNYNVGFPTDQYAGGTLVEVQNVGTAREVGSELDYDQNLGGLSPWLRGFEAYFNYSYTFGISNATYMGNGVLTGPPITTKLPIVNVYPHQFNTGISYTHAPFFVSLSSNWWSAEPTTVTAPSTTSAGSLTYVESRSVVNSYISWTFWKNNALYIDARNVFNNPMVSYILVPYRVRTYTLFGSSWNVGIKGTF